MNSVSQIVKTNRLHFVFVGRLPSHLYNTVVYGASESSKYAFLVTKVIDSLIR